jgi:hypothetical protein
MSQTFTLQGVTHELSCDYHPVIDLDPRANYSLGLISFRTYNTIPNIDAANNRFYYDKDKVVIIPEGSYEIEDIERYLRSHLNVESKEDGKALDLKPNNNTLQCELRCRYDVDFTPGDSIGRILGFSSRLLEANVQHVSDIPVNIIRVSSVRIECNIITGAYYDSKLSHTLFEFSPNVDPGYAININPSSVIYLPLNVSSISNITLRLLDQDGKPVNFRGEHVLARLELKKDGY